MSSEFIKGENLALVSSKVKDAKTAWFEIVKNDCKFWLIPPGTSPDGLVVYKADPTNAWGGVKYHGQGGNMAIRIDPIQFDSGS